MCALGWDELCFYGAYKPAQTRTVGAVQLTELKDDRMENYGAYIGFISKQHCRTAK